MIKNLFKLASATIVGQVATLILMSVLFKFGLKDEIANFALFMAILAIVTPISTMRLDIAFLVNKKNSGIANYLLNALVFSCLIIIPIMIIFKDEVSAFYNTDVQMIPVFAILIVSNVGVLFSHAFLNRNGEFKKLSILFAAQPLVQCGAASIFIIFEISNLLIYSLILSQLSICILTLGWGVRKISYQDLEVIQTLKKNWRYPILSSPGAVMNSYQLALPIIYATQHFPPSSIAVYYLLQKFISSPLGILSNAAYNISIHDLLEKSKFQAIKYILKYCVIMVILILLCLVIFSIIPEEIFFLILEIDVIGKNTIMLFTISIIIRSIASPLSAIIPICGAIHIEFIWKLLALIVTYSCFYHFIHLENFNSFLYVIAVLDISLYSLLIMLSIYSVSVYD